MDDPIMSFEGNGQPDVLSIINSEAEKVEPVNKLPPTPPVAQAPVLELPESLPSPPDQPKETSHLKASTFAEPVLPIDWFSEPVQEYIRTVSESYGCPLEYVVVNSLFTASIAAGKKAQLATNPYTNYPCDFFCMVGKPSRNKTEPLKEVTVRCASRTKPTLPNTRKKKPLMTNASMKTKATAVSNLYSTNG
jgi:hypothetical protein